MPSLPEVVQAIDTLALAGYSVQGPAHRRLQLLSVGDIQELIRVGEGKAREILKSLPGSVMLPGGDLRARAADVEAWIERHRLPTA